MVAVTADEQNQNTAYAEPTVRPAPQSGQVNVALSLTTREGRRLLHSGQCEFSRGRDIWQHDNMAHWAAAAPLSVRERYRLKSFTRSFAPTLQRRSPADERRQPW